LPKRPVELVSIIIPCWNGEGFVGDAIRSALAQTYARKEVIVVDDGSTDRSLDVIASFGDAIRWESGPNRGGSAARNRGLALANGQLIQFLDADDVLHPQKLEVQVEAIRSSPAQVTFCWGNVEPDSEWRNQFRRPYAGDAVEFLLDGPLHIPAPLHRREVLRASGGFRIELDCAQEFDLHLRMACMGVTFDVLPVPLFTVRQTPGSVSSDPLRVLARLPEIVFRARDILIAGRRSSDARARALAAVLTRGSRVWLRHRRYPEAERFLRLARQIHPGGGIERAYGPRTRPLLRLLGPRLVEKCAVLASTVHRCIDASAR
jgi:glycosyltransferase involved in cell wall biosynthesis